MSRQFELMRRITAQQDLIRDNGNTLRGYRARYGTVEGKSRFDADMGELDALQSQLRDMIAARNT